MTSCNANWFSLSCACCMYTARAPSHENFLCIHNIECLVLLFLVELLIWRNYSQLASACARKSPLSRSPSENSERLFRHHALFCLYQAQQIISGREREIFFTEWFFHARNCVNELWRHKISFLLLAISRTFPTTIFPFLIVVMLLIAGMPLLHFFMW